MQDLYKIIQLFTGIIASLFLIIPTSCDQSGALNRGLEGHWPLREDAADISGKGRDALTRGGVMHGVAGKDAKIPLYTAFDGINSFLEVPADISPDPGKKDFSVSVWINVSDEDDDVPGDILSNYDPEGHKGFQLSIKSNAVTTSQTNSLQLFFGIDNCQMTDWTDCGRPGNAVCAFSMASFQGGLYVGTCEAGEDEFGHVYRFGEDGKWTDCGPPDSSNAVMSLAVYNGDLYAGTAKYRLAGSALEESGNLNPGGRIFRYEKDQWIYCGRLPASEAIGGLIVYKDHLYASSLYHPAGFYRYEGDTVWAGCGTPDGNRVVALGVYNGYIYATSYDGGHVFRYDGDSWTDCGLLGSNTQTYSFSVYHGRLFTGTWPSGRVYRFEDINRWTDMGRLGNELEVMGMINHNGRLIAGTLPLAEVYSYEGDTLWKKMVRLDNTPDVRYRRAWIMAEHGGKVFCSTLPSGNIFSCEIGKSVMSDYAVGPGWHHVAAMRTDNHLVLWLDGKELARSEFTNPDLCDLSNNEPLRIGFGPNDFFNGSIADLRYYSRALTGEEIRKLAKNQLDQN